MVTETTRNGISILTIVRFFSSRTSLLLCSWGWLMIMMMFKPLLLLLFINLLVILLVVVLMMPRAMIASFTIMCPFHDNKPFTCTWPCGATTSLKAKFIFLHVHLHDNWLCIVAAVVFYSPVSAWYEQEDVIWAREKKTKD